MDRPLLCLLLVSALLISSCTHKGAEPGKPGAAPASTATDIKHKKVSLGDYKGRVVLLEFFATWCAPCRMAAPEIKSVYEKYKDKGFIVLAVSIDEGSDAEPAVDAFVKEFSLPFPVILDDGELSKQYGVVGIPTSIIIDKQGKVGMKHIGVVPDMPRVLSRDIEALL